ncbi:MAG: hypothetical protein Q7S12_02940 [bacterium]|nr:hypothetical protein [bacterium]
MRKLSLTKNQQKKFFWISAIATLPFLVLTLLEAIKNEGGLIMLLPMMAGLPWVFLYLVLPFEIPGFTSAAIPNAQGDNIMSIFELILFMIPVYVNIYLLVHFVSDNKVEDLTQTNKIQS